MDSFGKRLEIKRKEKGLSQDELARLMSKSHRTVVSAWEKDKSEPSISDVRKLAEVLETSVAYLIEGIEVLSNQSIVSEAPAGYILKSTEDELKEKDEKLQLQRELLKYQKRIIEGKDRALAEQK